MNLPVLFAKEHKGIRYALRLLPIGGFLSMEGEDEGSGDSAAFCNKGVGWRVLVTVAGALMNVLLGFVLLIILISSQDLIGTRIVAGFNEGATSQASGLMAEDEILSINGAGVFIDNDIVYQLLRDPDGGAAKRGKGGAEKCYLPDRGSHRHHRYRGGF